MGGLFSTLEPLGKALEVLWDAKPVLVRTLCDAMPNRF